MMYRISEGTTRIYEADADALKDEFPEEYMIFCEEATQREVEPTDEAWIMDCFFANPDLFKVVYEGKDDWYVERTNP